MNLFKLFGELQISGVDESIEGLNRTEQGVDGVSNALKKTPMQKFGQAAKTTGKVVGTTAVAVGAASVAAFKFVDAQTKQLDVVDKQSQRLGVNAETYQELDYVMSQNGASISSLVTGSRNLTNQMDMAAQGSETSARFFNTLGVEIQNTDGSLRSMDEMLPDVLHSLAGMENETERNAIANQLLGRSAQELIPMLNEGSESFDNLRQEAQDLGFVMGDDVVKAGAGFQDTLDRLQRTFGGIMAQAAGKLIPIIEDIFKALEPLFPVLMDLITELAPVIEELAPLLVEIITEIIKELMPVIKSLLPVIVEIVKKLLPPLIHIIIALLPLIVKVIELLEPILEILLPILEAALKAVAWIIENVVVPALSLFIDWIGKGIEWITNIGANISETWDNIKNWTSEKWGEVTKFLGDTWDGMKKKAKETWETVSKNVSTTWEGMKTTAKEKFEGLKENVQLAWQGMLGWFEENWDDQKSIGENLVTMIWNGISGLATWIYEEVTGFVKDKILKPILNFLGIDSDTVKEIGSNLVKGIWNGITGLGTWIRNKVTGFFRDRITNPIKNFLGISSPSKVFQEFGKNLVEGLTEGIELNAQTAVTAVEAMARDILNAGAQMTMSGPRMGMAEAYAAGTTADSFDISDWRTMDAYERQLPKSIAANIDAERDWHRRTADNPFSEGYNPTFNISTWEMSPERVAEVVNNTQQALAVTYGI